MSKIGEFVLSKLSRDPKVGDYANADYEQNHRDIHFCVDALTDTFPQLKRMIDNKKVLDIGCAEGMESEALSMLGASEVTGIDIRIDRTRRDEITQNRRRRLSFAVMDAERTAFPDESFDAIVTCGSFEHFRDPGAVLEECLRVLREDGRVFLTSGVWAHPWGAHMNFFTTVPWVQFLFSESTVMNVRKLYRNDGATRYADVEGGLNKIGIRRLLKFVRDLDLEIEYLKLNPVKGLAVLTGMPFINELFTGIIVLIVKKKHSYPDATGVKAACHPVGLLQEAKRVA